MGVIRLMTPEQTGRYVGPAMGAALALSSWCLILAGQWRAAVQWLAVSAWLLVTVVAALQGGVRTPAVVIYPVIIMLIGWLFSGRMAALVATLTVVNITGLVAAEMAGLLPVPAVTPSAMYGILLVLVAVLAAFMINSMIRTYNHRLDDLSKTAAELARRTQELEISQANLGIAIESTRMVFWEYDFATDHLTYSKGAVERLDVGTDNSPHSLSDWLALVHPEDQAPFMARFSQAAKLGNPAFEFDYRVSGPHGIWIWHHTRGTVLQRNSAGKPVLAGGGSLNITERKQAEEQVRDSEARALGLAHMLRLLCDNVPDMIWAKDLNNRFIFANKAICDELLTATGTHEPIGKDDMFFAQRERERHPDNPQWHTFGELCQDSDKVTLQNAKASRFDEFGNVRGKFMFLDVHKAPFLDEQGEVIGVVGSARNVTQQKVVEDKLQLAALVLENSSEAMMIVDADNCVLEINPAFTRVTGYSRDEILGKTPAALSSGRQEPEFYRTMWEALATTGQWQGEIWNRRQDGQFIAEWLTINTLYTKGGVVHRRVALFSDITEKKKADELVWVHANFDMLTQLPNRRMFYDRLTQELKKVQRSGLTLALLFLDLDHFKEVNDTLGHDKGDVLLTEAARRIVGCVRETDTVARMGGDEFTVILTDIEESGSVDRVAQSIIFALSQPFQIGPHLAQVSASLGVALHPHDAAEADELLNNADQAMYAAKSAGRNRFSYFTSN